MSKPKTEKDREEFFRMIDLYLHKKGITPNHSQFEQGVQLCIRRLKEAEMRLPRSQQKFTFYTYQDYLDYLQEKLQEKQTSPKRLSR